MSRIFQPQTTPKNRGPASGLIAWWPILVGLALLYLPTWWELAHTTWHEEEQSHGPIALIVAVYLTWLRRREIIAAPSRPLPLAGWSLLGLGLMIYAVGRSQQVIIFETASQIPVLLSLLLLTKGVGLVRIVWFPILYLAFMIPLPGFLVSDATGPLKQSVSAMVETCLYQLGYPVARSGVTLIIGQYQLLVADACSGLNSIIALTAVGLLYVYLMWRRGWPGNALLLAAILPAAYAANVLRVIVIVLLTYYAGDATAQGALHGAAGVALFSSAVLLLIALDALLVRLIPPPAEQETIPTTSPATVAPHPAMPLRAAGLAMLAASGLAIALSGQPQGHITAIDLKAMIPERFGDWQVDKSVTLLPQPPEIQEKLDTSYNQTLVRNYINAAGQRLMLVLAYGDSAKVHNPEVCYPGQGFALTKQEEAIIEVGNQYLTVQHLLTYRPNNVPEPVTFWVMVGDRVSRFGAAWRLQQLKYSLLGQVRDGLVFRVSSPGMAPSVAYDLQADFVRKLVAAVPTQTRVRLTGEPQSSR